MCPVCGVAEGWGEPVFLGEIAVYALLGYTSPSSNLTHGA